MKRQVKSDPRAALTGEALVALMRAAGRLASDLDVACREHGITHDQYNLLRILRGVHPAGHPRGEIAARLINRAPDVTRMLDRLVSRGLVRRGWHAQNRRLSIATITSDGLALLAEVDQSVAREHARHASRLSEADLKTLRRVCQVMTA